MQVFFLCVPPKEDHGPSQAFLAEAVETENKNHDWQHIQSTFV